VYVSVCVFASFGVSLVVMLSSEQGRVHLFPLTSLCGVQLVSVFVRGLSLYYVWVVSVLYVCVGCLCVVCELSLCGLSLYLCVVCLCFCMCMSMSLCVLSLSLYLCGL